MSILCMMPIWHSTSETWIQRMLMELGDELSVIVSWNTNGFKKWENRVDAVSLIPCSRRTRFCYRLLYGATRSSDSLAHMILKREIYRHRIKRILCHYGEFAVTFMSVWREVNIPLYVHIHGYDATLDLRLADNPNKKYFNENYRNELMKLADLATFIVNSEFSKSLLVDIGISPNRIFVKYLGVPISSTQKKHFKTENINVLHLGRLVDCKSPDRTLKAFEIAKEKGMNGKLVIAGDGPLRTTCELLRKRSPYKDSIQILGAVEACDAKKLLAEADIFTQHNVFGEITRQSESFGVSIIEAMAEGLPVVGTISGGVSEAVVNGETGILVAPGDIESQANAIYELSINPLLRQKLGSAGYKRVFDHFSMEHEAKRLRKIMNL